MQDKNKNTLIIGELNGYFLTVLPGATFKTQPKVYGGALLQKQLTTFSC